MFEWIQMEIESYVDYTDDEEDNIQTENDSDTAQSLNEDERTVKKVMTEE